MRLESAAALLALASGVTLAEACAPFDWRLREHAQLLGSARLAALQAVPAASSAVLVAGLAACEPMLAAVESSAALALDCEGERLSRHGRMCLLQVSRSEGEG